MQATASFRDRVLDVEAPNDTKGGRTLVSMKRKKKYSNLIRLNSGRELGDDLRAKQHDPSCQLAIQLAG